MPKSTRLDDSADIYQPRTEKTEKEKLKDMNLKEKLAYLWEYYKIHALVIIGVVALIIYIVREIVTPDINTVFNAVVINSPVDSIEMQKFADSFGQHLQLDPRRENVTINDGFYTDSVMANSALSAIPAYIAGKILDVIIAPESEIQPYAANGYLKKLSEALPTDIYSSLTDYFYMSELNDDPDNPDNFVSSEESPYGIYLDNTKLFKGRKYNSESYVLGIVVNSQHTDNAVEFIKYLFEEKQ